MYGIVFFLAFAAAGPASADARTVRIAYLGRAGTATWDGVRLGLAEAGLQGRFLGRRFAVDRYAGSVPEDLDTRKYAAVLSTLESADLYTLSSRYSGIPIFNLTAKDDRLRKICLPFLFHIIQSNAMETDAVQQWRADHPADTVHATAWHHDFVKYAARDLNKRFTKGYGRQMDERAWAGWAAVRMIADVVIRGTAAEHSAIREYLKTRLSFDGQKGLNMTFRETGQLRQPLLLIGNGKILAEAPVRGIVAADDYDSLGITACSE